MAAHPPAHRQLQRALGVDYGRRQIGLAVSSLGLAPRPLPFLRGGGWQGITECALAVVEAAAAAGCDGIVIGLPVTLAGALRDRRSDSQQGRRCRNFADAVAGAASARGLEVLLVDERGTTRDATELLHASGARGPLAKGRKDSVAAALILSAYFDAPGEAQRVRPPGSGGAPPSRELQGGRDGRQTKWAQ